MSKKPIQLQKEIREQMIEEIKSYYWNEEEEEISSFKAEQLIDFFLTNLAANIYNQGIKDAYAFMMEKTEDMLGLEKRNK